MENDKRKRARARNFGTEEVRLLLNLALQEKHVLENKRTDSESWKLKEEIWKKIETCFNSSSGQVFRSAETLRSKYDSMKKDLKKKINKNKLETFKTGGGKPDYIKIEGPEKSLLEVLSLSINGLSSMFDSDSMLPQTTINGEPSSSGAKFMPESNKVDEVAEACAKLSEQNDAEIPIIVVNDRMDENIWDDETQADTNMTILNVPQTNLDIGKSTQVVVSPCCKPEFKSWKNWSPGILQSKKHPILTPKKNKALKNICKESLNKKIDANIDLRDEWVKHQIIFIKNEELRAQEKHAKEMELLDLSIALKKKELEKP